MASSPVNEGLFEDVHPSPFKISPGDHSAYILLPALIMFAITALVVLVKVLTAWTVFRKLRMDDYAVVAALIFYLARTVTLCLSARYGLGRIAERSSEQQVRKMSQLYLASEVLLYPLLACAKCTVALLLIQIQNRLTWVLWSTCGAATAWAVAAICVLPSQCTPRPWVMGPTGKDVCIDQQAAQIGIKVFDILSDIVLSMLPGILFMRLHMRGSKRLTVACVFALRIVTPVFTTFSLITGKQLYAAPTVDRPFEAIDVSVWTSIAAGTSIITACIPSIRRFIADYAAGVSNTIMGDGDIALSSLSNSKSSWARKHGASRTWVSRGEHAPRSKGNNGESSTDLTGHIVHTTHFDVHSEPLQEDDGRNSRLESRGSSEVSLVAPVGNNGRPARLSRATPSS